MGKKLFVGGLPYETTDLQLKELFGQCGAVLSAKVIIDRETGKSKGFGFVEMTTDDQAKAAILKFNSYTLGTRRIMVNEARPPEPRPAGGYPPRPAGGAPGGGFGGPRPGGFGGPPRGGGDRNPNFGADSKPFDERKNRYEDKKRKRRDDGEFDKGGGKGGGKGERGGNKGNFHFGDDDEDGW